MGIHNRSEKKTDGVTSAPFALLPMESRLYLAANVSTESPSPLDFQATSHSSARLSAASGDTGLTIADRQLLISHFSGPLAASLAKTLRHSGPDAFDATLLKFMT